LRDNTTAPRNTAVGYGTLANNNGENNSALGQTALGSNTSGTNNSALGYDSLSANTTGAFNSAFGKDALRANTTASNNTAVGYQALYTSTTGANNTALGYRAGYVVTGGDNVFIGVNTGSDATTGTSNTFVGRNAGGAVTTGGSNTILGRFDGNTGIDIRTASNYVVLSGGGGNPEAYVAGGGASWYQRSNSASWATTSDQRIKENIISLKNGLSVITALRPVEFDYITTKKHEVGFIAQEYKQVLPEQITYENNPATDIKELTNGEALMGIQQNLVPYLVKAIQELNAKVEAQALEIATLKGN
jgi:hypothetical protein